uniref:Uncharacterized protein n=1 Tax=Amphimedon queenslandica TaxID=400682 RepID=A0A1X7T7Y1_AMPQE
MFNYLVFVSVFCVAVRFAEGTCTKGAIRYDPEYNSTVVQICFNNRWGYICANSDERDRQRIANVICQQMGYSRHFNTGIHGVTQIKINPAPKPGFIRWLHCSDKPIPQQNILDCSHEVYESAYSDPVCSANYNLNNNYYIAASNCINTSVCQNGQIQLLDTNAVLLCVNGEWHALCSTTWSYTQAQVVCRQLGKNAIGAITAPVPANYSVLPANFECHGNEKFLFNCSDSDSRPSYSNICENSTVAGVMCQDLPGPPSNLTISSQQSDIMLHWEYTDDANGVSNFSVYCKHNVTVDPQLHLIIKTELSLLTKNNSATLIGLLANTVYTCCVSAVFPYMETESTCINVSKGFQEAGSSTSFTLSFTPTATATVASSSSNGAIPWIGGILIGIIISAVFVIILLLIIKIVIIRKSKDKQFKPNKRSSLQSDNVNVTSTVYHQSRGQTQNIGIYSDLSQNQFEPFSNGRDPAVPDANDYESPVDVNIMTVNNDPVYSLAETEEETDHDSISCDNIFPQTTVIAGAICEDLPGPPSNLTVNSQQSDIILHWEYTDDANNVSNFSVYCKHNKTIDPQLHFSIKTELSLLTKNNSATLIGLLANTVYTCCVSAVFPYMETESTCINVTKGFQEASSSTSFTISFAPAATATVASSSSSNGAISWIGGIFIGIIISAVFVIILLLIIKIVITRRSKDKQFEPNKRSSLQSDNVNVTSTVYHQSRGQTQNIGIYSDLSQNQFEPFSNGRDPAVPGANDYESPVDVNIMTINNDPVYSLAETEEETGITQIKMNPAPTPGFIGWIYCSDKPILQQNILDCLYNFYEPAYLNLVCSNNHYAAASNCINTLVCQNGQIQLLDTNAVLLCVNGEWHALCSTTWSSTPAQVVCRQLGKDAKGAMPVNVSVPANISVLQANFECYGNEKFLCNCSDHSISCDDLIFQTEIIVAGVICQNLPGPPSNLSVYSQQSDIILHWEYTDDANNVSNFNVYCKHDMIVDPQLHLSIKTELNTLTKNNSASLIGLLANTVYTCCVSAVSPYMETESTCINVTKEFQETCSSTSFTIIVTATVASSLNGAIPWIGGIFIGIIISAVFVIILLLIIKIFIIRRSKDKQFEPNKRSSLKMQCDNSNVISTISSGQNVAYGVHSQDQSPLESFVARSDPTTLEYASPFDVLQQNRVAVNDNEDYI